MTSLYCPANISILLHCHCSPEPIPHYIPSDDAPPVTIEAIDGLMAAGAIEPDREAGEGHFRTTPLGRAWVKALCDLPPPRQAFIDQAGRVINDV